MTPAFRIVVEGQGDVTHVLRDRLLALRITDEAGVDSDTLELRLDDRAPAIAYPRHGVRLSAALGYAETGLVEMGTYVVDEVTLEGPPDTLTVRAKAADVRSAAKAPRSRSFTGKTLGQIVATIAAELGLTPAVAPALASQVLAHVVQSRESALAFLTRISRQFDAVVKPAGGRLLVAPRGEAASVSGQDLSGAVLHREQLTRWSVTLADRGRYGQVHAVTYDYDAAAQVVQPSGSGSGPVHSMRHPLPDGDSASRAARARQRALDRGAATLSAELPGIPTLTAESPVDIEGIRPGVDGRWLIAHVEHVLESGGYSCRIECTRGDPAQQRKGAKRRQGKAKTPSVVYEFDPATGTLVPAK